MGCEHAVRADDVPGSDVEVSLLAFFSLSALAGKEHQRRHSLGRRGLRSDHPSAPYRRVQEGLGPRRLQGQV
eukprot:677643-Rhodomonas_salina.5